MNVTRHSLGLTRPARCLRLASLLAGLAAAWLLAATPGVAVPTHWSCADAISYEVGQPIHWIAGTGQRSALLALHVESAGRLALEARNLDDGGAATWLEVVRGNCGDLAGEHRIESYLDRGLFDVEEPGTVLVRVGRIAERPMASTLRVSTRLLAFEPDAAGDKDGDPGDDTGEEDREILPFAAPAPGAQCGLELSMAWSRLAKSFDKDGDPGDDTGEEDREILPFSAPGDGCESQSVWNRVAKSFDKDGDPGDDTGEEDREILPFAAPGDHCGSESADDLAYFARPVEIGGKIESRLTPSGGFDADYYTFRVASLETIRVDATSETGSRTLLLDGTGRTLASTELAESGRLEATLAAGRYFLRIEGDGDGGYRLDLNSVSEP